MFRIADSRKDKQSSVRRSSQTCAKARALSCTAAADSVARAGSRHCMPLSWGSPQGRPSLGAGEPARRDRDSGAGAIRTGVLGAGAMGRRSMSIVGGPTPLYRRHRCVVPRRLPAWKSSSRSGHRQLGKWDVSGRRWGSAGFGTGDEGPPGGMKTPEGRSIGKAPLTGRRDASGAVATPVRACGGHRARGLGVVGLLALQCGIDAAVGLEVDHLLPHARWRRCRSGGRDAEPSRACIATSEPAGERTASTPPHHLRPDPSATCGPAPRECRLRCGSPAAHGPTPARPRRRGIAPRSVTMPQSQ